jgi:hypothetical protein
VPADTLAPFLVPLIRVLERFFEHGPRVVYGVGGGNDLRKLADALDLRVRDLLPED